MQAKYIAVLLAALTLGATDPAFNDPGAAVGPLWSWIEAYPTSDCAVAFEGPGGRWRAFDCSPHETAWCGVTEFQGQTATNQNDHRPGLRALCENTGGALGPQQPVSGSRRITGSDAAPSRLWVHVWARCEDGVDGAVRVALACPWVAAP